MKILEKDAPFAGARMSARERFKGFKPEAEKPSRKPAVQENPTQAALLKVWHEKPFSTGNPDFENDYFRALVGKTPVLRQISIKAEDVAAFCISLSSLNKGASREDENDFSSKAGVFLSVLVYLSKDTHFTLPLDHLDERLDFLGYRNNKNVRIKGDVGINLGEMMSGGSIEVDGDVGVFLGYQMIGGTITINGNSDDFTGSNMRGGDIRVSGTIRGYEEEPEGGRIYEAGVLLIEGGDADEDY